MSKKVTDNSGDTAGIIRFEDLAEHATALMTPVDRKRVELCDELINEGKADDGLFEALLDFYKKANETGGRYRKSQAPEPRALDALIAYAVFMDGRSDADLWKEVYEAAKSVCKYIYVCNSLNAQVNSSTFLPTSDAGLNKELGTLSINKDVREIVKVRSFSELGDSDTRILSGSLIAVDEAGVPQRRNIYADLQR